MNTSPSNTSTSPTNTSTETRRVHNAQPSSGSAAVVTTMNRTASSQTSTMSIGTNNANGASDVLNEGNEESNKNDESNMSIEVDDDVGIGIVSGTSQTSLTSNSRRRSSHLLNSISVPSSSITRSKGQHLCCIILTQAKREGYRLTIGFGKRIEWLRQGEKSFFKPGDILCDYKVAKFGSLRKKLAQAEIHAMQLFNAKQHNNNESNPTEDLSSYVKHFFDYFEWKEDNHTKSNDGIQYRDEIWRSLIGQQASLANATEDIVLRTTRAKPNRTPGSGDVATNIQLIDRQSSIVSNNYDSIDNNDSSISLESSV